ncbi:class I SAM-dependent methyltransferase [Streptomyces physcomitrii]|uniref:Class I SAM-dependent methyltransferase n=1 Tax=Streptomyces physcomitrii TaxID=2724184 RepID=A0ABX1H0D8_9ACTN|nr:class I SAM-dependent methyltransferase [Streptomyces physcomitrii]NKI41498.1 class I SAM-dependent methyltransferase [Streptomyces physcomitrii]
MGAGSGSGAARGFGAVRGSGGPPAAAGVSGALEPGRVLRSRARALLPYAEPESWLDIESGAARFPRAARELLPYTAFDALGATGVAEALAAGRIDAGLPGTLRALAPRIAGHYDALSMFHRLQHSAEPGAELRAARTVLRPGGHLVLDCANPASWSGRLLARRAAAATGRDPRAVRPLLLTSAALEGELTRLGFMVLGTGHRGGVHVPCELTALVARLLPGGRGPGAPGRRVPALPGALRLPLLAAARLLDQLLALALRGPRLANSYRIVARREPDTAADPLDSPEPPTSAL